MLVITKLRESDTAGEPTRWLPGTPDQGGVTAVVCRKGLASCIACMSCLCEKSARENWVPGDLLSQFKLDITYTYDIAWFCRDCITCRLVIDKSTVHATCVLYIPDTITKPHTGMFGGHKTIRDLDNISRATPDI